MSSALINMHLQVTMSVLFRERKTFFSLSLSPFLLSLSLYQSLLRNNALRFHFFDCCLSEFSISNRYLIPLSSCRSFSPSSSPFFDFAFDYHRSFTCFSRQQLRAILLTKRFTDVFSFAFSPFLFIIKVIIRQWQWSSL